jgi:hypothetical protein
MKTVKTKRKPFRVIARYKSTCLDDEKIERVARREAVGRGTAFSGATALSRELEFEYATRLSALRAAQRITETCRGVKCEVRGRIWP